MVSDIDLQLDCQPLHQRRRPLHVGGDAIDDEKIDQGV
jgi:hypothetical protein